MLDISYSTLKPPNDNTTDCNLMRPITSHGIKKLRTMLQLNSWKFITEQTNINNDHELLLLDFCQIFSICLPQKIIKHRQSSSKSWITRGLLFSSRKKAELYKNNLVEKIDFNLYKSFRNKFTLLVRSTKALCCKNYTNSHRINSKAK